MLSRALLITACFTLASQAATVCGGHGDSKSMLVSTAWLAGHLNDPNLVVIGVGSRGEYDKGHLPGSGFIDLQAVSAPGTALTLELAPMAQLTARFRALGVSNDSRVVLYTTGSSIQSTTRIFLTLDAMGLGRNTSLLDGGYAAWTAESRATTTEVKAPKAGTVEPCAQSDIIVDSAYVSSNVRKPGVDIIDARLPVFYTGEQIPTGQRAGHIAGAASLPFNSMVDDKGKLKSAEDLASMFTSAGIKTGDRVVSYCHVGQQATVIYFVARYLGFDARLYDGSMQDWSAKPDLPMEHR
jgi:thiosulfate/3-mercaptopyruvate sulfurtransferase